MKQYRRIAANRVSVEDKEIGQAIVVLEGCNVIKCQPFSQERSNTEWIGGTVTIRNTERGMRAYKDGVMLSSYKDQYQTKI